jgi:hypothetical protein
MIFTQPVGARTALRAYRGGDLSSPTAAVRIAIVPLVAKNASGVVLALTF